LFLIREVARLGCAISAIPELFGEVFPSESKYQYNDLEIKHFNIKRRDKFINKLYKKYGILGWLSSIEDKIDVEVCLFAQNENNSLIQLMDKKSDLTDEYKYDSLRKFKLYPSESFYEKSNKRIGDFTYDKYKKRLINERRRERRYEKKCSDRKDKGPSCIYYDLRQKLKL